MDNLTVEQEKAKEYDELERESQRQSCRNYIVGLHTNLFRLGFKKGTQRIKDTKVKIGDYCTKSGEYVWTAGQMLIAQSDMEKSGNDKCRFRFEPELYTGYVKAIEERREELEQFDAVLYEESAKIAEELKKRSA